MSEPRKAYTLIVGTLDIRDRKIEEQLGYIAMDEFRDFLAAQYGEYWVQSHTLRTHNSDRPDTFQDCFVFTVSGIHALMGFKALMTELGKKLNSKYMQIISPDGIVWRLSH